MNRRSFISGLLASVALPSKLVLTGWVPVPPDDYWGIVSPKQPSLYELLRAARDETFEVTGADLFIGEIGTFGGVRIVA